MIWNLISWYGLFLLLGWAAFPLSFRLFRKLPDRGYTLSRALGLLLWGFGFWLLASLGVLQNNPGGILLALAVLLGLSVWAGWGRWAELWRWVRSHWQFILTAEIVFLLAFGFMALVRGANPEATGTEKPMELAFINAILHSETFPPHDPWLSGYAISYYHFGYILAAMLAKVTATNGGVAFNLMLTAVFAMSAVGAYGLLYDLLSAFEEGRPKPGKNWLWGLFGPVFLLFVSNLEGVLEVLHQAGVGWDRSTGASRFWQWVNLESLLSPPSGTLTLIPQRYWWWWQASRVVQDIDLTGAVSALSPIDEFPAFSFVLGDLHPHVLVMPFVMLVIGLALNIFRGGLDANHTLLGREWPFRWDLFLVCAVTLGGIIFLNTWDLPVYFALLVGAYTLRQIRLKGWDGERLGDLLKLAFPLALLSVILYLPFIISFQSQAGGILPNLVYPTRGLYFWVMFGSLLIPLFLFFIWLARQRAPAKWGWGTGLVSGLVLLLLAAAIGLGAQLYASEGGASLLAAQRQTSFGELLAASLGHRLAYGVGLGTLAVLLILGVAYLLGLARPKGPDQDDAGVLPFILWMIVLGAIMALAPEFVYLRDNFGARMNTVFKFYYQAWMLWSLAAAFATVILLKRGKWVSRLLVVVILLLGLVYPVLAYLDRTNGFQPVNGFSLDAGAYLADDQPDEAAAIAWLAAAPEGVVAEAVGGQYSGYARVATLSGQPTVLGWPGHEGQWRGSYLEVGTREPDIRTLYETADWQIALEIVRRYDIRYIYVGGLEYSTYALNPGKFEKALNVVFEQGNVRIYEVPEILRITAP